MKSHQDYKSITFPLRVALIGTPDCFDTRFDDSQLDALKRLGFNTVQINIAWGPRGNDEPLNIEDILGPADGQPGERENRWLAEMQRRARAVKKHGLRCIFHGGIPQLAPVGIPDREAAVQAGMTRGTRCIQSEEVREGYRHLIGKLAQVLPEVDDLMVYTFDQDAWVCSEFGDCPRCRTVPLHERLPAFLQFLRDTWRRHRPLGMFWWEPWELSAGQTYAILDYLPTEGFGLMLHGNFAEVQMSHRADDWFRNLARWAGRRGIPVVGELFLTSSNEEIGNLLQVPCPRLVWESVRTLEALPGVVGIKEYYGTLPDRWDPNLSTASAALRGEPSLEKVLQRIVAPFGPAAADLRSALAAMDDAMEAWPWDLCWKYRNAIERWPWIFNARGGAQVQGHLVDSPAWCSTRRAHFMSTENDLYHPWFYEDVILRWRRAAGFLDQAIESYHRAIEAAPAGLPDLSPWRADALTLSQYARRLANWSESSSMCDLMRAEYRQTGRWNPRWASRLEAILQDDLARAPHQKGKECASELLNAWRSSPLDFLARYLHANWGQVLDLTANG